MAPRWLSTFYLLLACTLAGCTTTAVTVEAELPARPLVERTETTIAVVVDQDFQTAIHEEEIPRHGNWRFELGRAQTAIFEAALRSVFVIADETSTSNSHDQKPDFSIRPELIDVQFSIPSLTPTFSLFDQKFYEVWLKYNVQVTRRGEKEAVINFPLSGYGRSTDKMAEFSAAELEQAAIQALRDVGSTLLIDFPDILQRLIAQYPSKVSASTELSDEE